MLPKTLPNENSYSIVERDKRKDPKTSVDHKTSEGRNSKKVSNIRQLQAKNTIINSKHCDLFV